MTERMILNTYFENRLDPLTGGNVFSRKYCHVKLEGFVKSEY